MIGERRLCACPYLLDCLTSHLVLALNSGIPQGFGLGKTLGVRHFLGLGERAAYVSPPSLLHAHAPAPKTPRRDAVPEHQVPAGFVAVAG